MNTKYFVALAGVLGLSVACTSAAPTTTSATASGGVDRQSSAAADGAGSGGADGAATVAGPTYHKDISRIMTNYCVQCHSGGGIGPFALDNFAATKGTMVAGLGAIDARRMPPWSAWDTPNCKPRFGFRHDLRLNSADRATLGAWVTAGMPEGNVVDAPKAVVPKLLTLDAVEVIASPKAPFVSAGKDDQFRCFVLDVDYPKTKYLNGAQIQPGNPLVVHHVLLFIDPNNSSAKHANADGQYDCFGSAQLDQSGNLIAAWAPGSVPMEFPVGMGSTLPKGAKIVMQVHYHPGGQTAAPDLTKVQLRYVKGQPTMLGDTVLIGNALGGKDGEGLLPGPGDNGAKPQFVIPAGAVDHTEEMVFTIPPAINGKATPQFKVYAIGTHMHYVGRKMEIRVERSPPKAPCTEAMVAPLTKCTQEKCPNKAGIELTTCAQEACQTAVGGINALCGECLKTETLKGTSQQGTMLACTTAPAASAATGPAEECLIETPNWNFNWQRIYVYDAELDKLPVINGGDRLRLKCTYDNSTANPFLMDALKSQGKSAPIPVTLGEQTLDEMCLAVVQVLYKP